ncbi:beta-glucan synthesis-associated protein-domain-containing protein [Mycena polygramma]|nr:beta-glucan synthesis-associated protein-domain-containing protein [Mycena polygramma]
MSYPQQPPQSFQPNRPTPNPFATPRSSFGSATNYNIGIDPAGYTAKPEADDFLHDPRLDKKQSRWAGRRNVAIGCLVLVLLIVGVSVGVVLGVQKMNKNKASSTGSSALSDNANVPNITNWALIDVATPTDAHTIPSYHDPTKSMQLVFSDEFEVEGRSFYPGDDPYWEAANLHYWQTGDLEWYDPSAVTTRNGSLELTLSHVDDIANNYNLSYRSGMLSSWNKFCFTGGILLSSVTLPGTTNVLGLWPAVWAMGNLGRAGYGASLDGMCRIRQPPLRQSAAKAPPSPLSSSLIVARSRTDLKIFTA